MLPAKEAFLQAVAEAVALGLALAPFQAAEASALQALEAAEEPLLLAQALGLALEAAAFQELALVQAQPELALGLKPSQPLLPCI